MLRPAVLTAALFGTACQPATQVIVYVDADPSVLTGAASMRVRSCDVDDAPACDGGYERAQPLSAVELPARIPVGPPSDASARFWLEASLLDDAGAEINTVRVIAGFEGGAVRVVRLRFEVPCGGLACGATATCFEGACTDACIETQPESDTTRSTPIPCTSTSCECPCAGDTCIAGECVPATPVDMVVTGTRHTCAGDTGSSTIHCWGQNTESQLGLGADAEGMLFLTPTPISLAAPLHDLAAGISHTCAIVEDGRLFCWGHNARQRLGTSGFPTLPLPTHVAEPAGVVWDRIELTHSHTCGLTSERALYCWGYAENGQIGVFDEPLPAHQSTPVEVDDNNPAWEDVTVGQGHTCGLRDGGTRQCWGLNDVGQIAEDASMTQVNRPAWGGSARFADVEAGSEHTCAIERTTRALHCWGRAASGRLGLGEVTDEAVFRATPLPDARPWASVSLGGAHSCAIDAEGSLACWGDNAFGQLGVGGGIHDVPTEVVAARGWSRVSTSESHTCAVRSTGELYCWGAGGAGQLGESCGRENADAPCRVCLPPGS
jgi:alpha-tubulin suppressor-like RCC1 family protein